MRCESHDHWEGREGGQLEGRCQLPWGHPGNHKWNRHTWPNDADWEQLTIDLDV